jgi:hypothetical protein
MEPVQLAFCPDGLKLLRPQKIAPAQTVRAPPHAALPQPGFWIKNKPPLFTIVR